MYVESETSVARSRPEVFDYIAHAEWLPEYVTDFAWVRKLSDGGPRLGTEYSYKMERGQAEGTFRWTEFEPPSRLGWHGPPPQRSWLDGAVGVLGALRGGALDARQAPDHTQAGSTLQAARTVHVVRDAQRKREGARAPQAAARGRYPDDLRWTKNGGRLIEAGISPSSREAFHRHRVDRDGTRDAGDAWMAR